MSNTEYTIIGAMACLFTGWLLSRQGDPVEPVKNGTTLHVVESKLEEDSMHWEILKKFRDTAFQFDFIGKPACFTVEEARVRRKHREGLEEDTLWMRLSEPPKRKLPTTKRN